MKHDLCILYQKEKEKEKEKNWSIWKILFMTIVLVSNWFFLALKKKKKNWFFLLFAGDPICDLIPIYFDVFRGDQSLLKQFLESYKLPFNKMPQHESEEGGEKGGRLSYLAM
jgi:hypothetical protein